MKSKIIEIFPSLISANLLKLEEDIISLEPHCDGFHIDIMDFHFVQNLTWGPQFVNQIRKKAKKKLHLHLMVEYPEKYIERFNLNKNDIISIHVESPSTLSVEENLKLIKKNNLIPSVAINPFTPIESIIHLKSPIEHVLLMSVNPGFSGQKFLPHTLEKLKVLNQFKNSYKLDFKICMDGGITIKNCKELVKLGANQLAIASEIFKQKDKIKMIKNIYDLCIF